MFTSLHSEGETDKSLIGASSLYVLTVQPDCLICDVGPESSVALQFKKTQVERKTLQKCFSLSH